jgi:hypothetical protein
MEMEAVFRVGKSSFFPAISHGKEQEFDRKTPEKSENFPARNTASMRSSEPAVLSGDYLKLQKVCTQ